MKTPFWLLAARAVLGPLGWLFERLGSRFYIGLALVLARIVSWAILAGMMRGMQNQAYDLIMKSRFQLPPPHPDIVLVDIDEASLAGMASEYGRWPWPRSVMAEFTEQLSVTGPKAIVFDITFVDRDVDHPDADTYLAEVAAASPNTFYTMIRLNPDNDHLSELQLSSLAGVRRLADNAADAATVAMIVPYFQSRLSGNQLGTNNLYAGSDGVGRRYHVYRDVAGWRINSLPTSVVSALGGVIPDTSDILINWRGEPGVYPTKAFQPLFQRLLAGDQDSLAKEFEGKIVVIGSTAPSLFDLKPTPMSRNHPGLEILATAIDNLHTGDSLRQLPPWFYVLVTAVALALLATAFVYNVDYRLLNPVFTVVQTAFLVISFLFLNYSTLFVDLSAPFAAGLVYFFIVRLYSLGLNLRRNGHPLFSSALDIDNPCQVLILRCALPSNKKEARKIRTMLQRQAGMTNFGVSAPRIFKQSPLLATLYQDTLLIYWLAPEGQLPVVLQDLQDMLETTLELLAERGESCHFRLDTFGLTIDDSRDWRAPGRNALTRVLAPESQHENSQRIFAAPAFLDMVVKLGDTNLSSRLRAMGILV